MQDLIDVLYPIGLFIQRANSLKTLSRQYLDWAWPIIPSSSPCNPYEDLPPTLPLFVPPSLPEVLDVNAFRGAGRYASDSFRIYSHLLPGSGGPHQESRWVDKRSRALERYRATRPGVNGESMLEVETVGGYLSDEEDVGVEEWRTVRPTDKELRRYLVSLLIIRSVADWSRSGDGASRGSSMILLKVQRSNERGIGGG